jgi:predicted HD superfamily hydrolase involved in NAD metabolism
LIGTDFTADPQVQFWLERVQGMVKAKRFEHILRVAQLASEIAAANNVDSYRAYLAGVLHDLARDLPSEELLRLAPATCTEDASNPLAVHGRAARALLESWGFDDLSVLEAVEEHVTGPRHGNLIAVAVYVADVSEPGRGVNDDIRERAFVDLESAFAQAIFCKVRYLERTGKPVHPFTRAAFDRLLLEHPLPAELPCASALD